MTRYAACVDVGSTWTKAALVDLVDGTLAGTGAHRTTVDTDVLHGLDAAVAEAVFGIAGDSYEVIACSSAGGGLRLAVVGYERLVTAEAGHRVGLSAGARVVHVAAGPLDAAGVRALRAARPDVVLLVGGTDGGDADVLLHNANRLAAARMRIPIVVAGNADAAPTAVDVLANRGVPAIAAANVLPSIGVLEPAPARAAIRDVFLRHVIGGKRLSRGTRFQRLVRAATPDAVLTAVELLGDHLSGDLLVVDVGGATTDVYSVLTPDPEREAGPRREVAGTLWRSRTVEGDLGMRWNAPAVVAAARSERLVVAGDELEAAAARRAAEPGLIVDSPGDLDTDLRIASLAATVALRRHARGEAPAPGAARRGGKDLRDVGLVIGSGGVLRHAPAQAASAALGKALDDDAGGWALPRNPTVAIDQDYVLAAAGLLAAEHPAAAFALLKDRLYAG